MCTLDTLSLFLPGEVVSTHMSTERLTCQCASGYTVSDTVIQHNLKSLNTQDTVDMLVMAVCPTGGVWTCGTGS